MQNDVKQVDRDAGMRLAEHVLRNLSDKALRDVNPNDVFTHMAHYRRKIEAAKDAEYADKIAALQARVAELEGEYICKCGIRVTAHKCRDTEGGF